MALLQPSSEVNSPRSLRSSDGGLTEDRGRRLSTDGNKERDVDFTMSSAGPQSPLLPMPAPVSVPIPVVVPVPPPVPRVPLKGPLGPKIPHVKQQVRVFLLLFLCLIIAIGGLE